MKQQIATMERDIIAQGTTKRRMLTIGEMLNPEDQPPLVQRSVQPSPCEGKPAAEEKDKRHTNMAVRVSKEKRQRTQGPRKHVSKPYVVHRMRV